MKKLICAICLLFTAMVAMASVQLKAIGPPEPASGYDYQNVAILSIDGMAVTSVYQQFNIVEWPTPVMLNQEASEPLARVIDAYQMPATQAGISTMLDSYRWPRHNTEMISLQNTDPKFTYTIRAVRAYSFTNQRTDIK